MVRWKEEDQGADVMMYGEYRKVRLLNFYAHPNREKKVKRYILIAY